MPGSLKGITKFILRVLKVCKLEVAATERNMKRHCLGDAPTGATSK